MKWKNKCGAAGLNACTKVGMLLAAVCLIAGLCHAEEGKIFPIAGAPDLERDRTGSARPSTRLRFAEKTLLFYSGIGRKMFPHRRRNITAANLWSVTATLPRERNYGRTPDCRREMSRGAMELCK